MSIQGHYWSCCRVLELEELIEQEKKAADALLEQQKQVYVGFVL